MPRPFICPECGFDCELAPQHVCKPKVLRESEYSVATIDLRTQAVVRQVTAESRIEALKLEVLFNASDGAQHFIAEARQRGTRIT